MTPDWHDPLHPCLDATDLRPDTIGDCTMTELEDYLHELIVSELNPQMEYGDLHVDILEKIVKKLAHYIRSSREGYTWKGQQP